MFRELTSLLFREHISILLVLRGYDFALEGANDSCGAKILIADIGDISALAPDDFRRELV